MMMTGIVEEFKDSILRNLRHPPKKSTRFCIMDLSEEKDVAIWMDMHRYPEWMGLKMHIVLEDLMHRLPRRILKTAVHNVVHGWVCNYSMREIVWFLKRQRAYNTDRGIAPC